MKKKNNTTLSSQLLFDFSPTNYPKISNISNLDSFRAKKKITKTKLTKRNLATTALLKEAKSLSW